MSKCQCHRHTEQQLCCVLCSGLINMHASASGERDETRDSQRGGIGGTGNMQQELDRGFKKRERSGGAFDQRWRDGIKSPLFHYQPVGMKLEV